uniref:Uncharacterized protein n=1 Tax=Acrobeloides nanus TaxID=290746 RepID=A0A914ENX5_9BILA
VVRLLLEMYALVQSYFPYFLNDISHNYNYSFGIFKKFNHYRLPEQVFLWAIIIESLLGLVLVYFRLRSVKSGDEGRHALISKYLEISPEVCTIGVVVLGFLEMLGSIVFTVLVITGITRMVPINSLVITTLLIGTAAFGALLIFAFGAMLIFNSMNNDSTKSLKGYLVFATFRLMIGIIAVVSFNSGLLEAIIYWAIIIESLLGLVFVYFRLRLVKSDDEGRHTLTYKQLEIPHGLCTLGVVVVGLLETLGSIIFAVLAVTGIGRMIPINSLVCAPLWMGTAVFGALLIFNRMINSTKILKGYLVFATFRLMVGIATAIFFLTGLLEAINSNQDILCDRHDGPYLHFFCLTNNRKSNYSKALGVLGVLFIIGMISIRVVYKAFKQHRKLELEEGNNDGKGKNIDRNLDFYRSQATMDLCPYKLSKNFVYEQ